MALTRAIIKQVISRVCRVGQIHIAQVFNYKVLDSFHIILTNGATEKALPGIMTDMSSSLSSLLHLEDEFVVATAWVI